MLDMTRLSKNIRNFRNCVNNPRLFLYLGFGLIFLALICFPARVWVVVQPETPEIDLIHMGPIIAILIGVWSFPNLFLGIMESFKSKKATLPWLTSILCLANAFLALFLWGQIGLWHGRELQMLLSYSPFLAPGVMVNMIWLFYLAKGEKLDKALKNLIVRLPLLGILVIIPLLFAIRLLFAWLTGTTFY